MPSRMAPVFRWAAVYSIGFLLQSNFCVTPVCAAPGRTTRARSLPPFPLRRHSETKRGSRAPVPDGPGCLDGAGTDSNRSAVFSPQFWIVTAANQRADRRWQVPWSLMDNRKRMTVQNGTLMCPTLNRRGTKLESAGGVWRRGAHRAPFWHYDGERSRSFPNIVARPAEALGGSTSCGAGKRQSGVCCSEKN